MRGVERRKWSELVECDLNCCEWEESEKILACIMQTQRWIGERTINQSGFDAIRWTLTAHTERRDTIFHLETMRMTTTTTTRNLLSSSCFLIFMQCLDVIFFEFRVEGSICVMFYIPLFDHLIEIN